MLRRYHEQFHLTDMSLHHDDVIKWKHFPRYWPFVRRIHQSPVNSPHKGQWRGALMFSLICAWINGCVNKGEDGALRRHRAHYDVTVYWWRPTFIRAFSPSDMIDPEVDTESSRVGSILARLTLGNSSRSLRRRFNNSDCSSKIPHHCGKTNSLKVVQNGQVFHVAFAIIYRVLPCYIQVSLFFKYSHQMPNTSPVRSLLWIQIILLYVHVVLLPSRCIRNTPHH